ncbi:MAG TPA: bifunctional hydroxymethylpyrimidine kinase/phosphomethylpyrimidine kinase [Solirubrobacteraceae bacterium]|jgi:hydroxymethylpyrimidine/phosphomethylpyrimidine kinase|nr:bifunctional hydroxymethylpyrimidine kinase/phosphomethylpyrimidine kinase [Solirubrobacteraceae bacterium]
MPDIARTPRALSIAGSDSGGGAGIQADLKAFARCGVHGMSAITAITAQNTLGVDAIHALPPEIVLAQIRAVVADIGVDAVKVGMLGSVETVHAVALALDEMPPETPVVVDPVMVSESGARLLDADAESALIAEILPRASIVTPNIPEARVLAGHAARLRHGEPIETAPEDERSEAVALALAVSSLGPGIVVLTGGHRAQTIDLFLERGAKAEEVVEIPGERYPDGAAHGSGCTHSSVLAAQLALGHAPLQAAFTARTLAGEAVAGGLRDIGEGPGPVDVIGLDRMRSA